MKLKAALLITAATAGVGASVALADHGGQAKKCKAVHVSGTLAAASLSLTTKAGTAVSLGLPAGAPAKGGARTAGTTWTPRPPAGGVKAPKPAPGATPTPEGRGVRAQRRARAPPATP